MATKLSKENRKVSAETMASVMKYSPKDGFKLMDNILNKVYTIIEVDEYEVGGNKTFSVSMVDEDGNVITISASALKRSRIFTGTGTDGATPYMESSNVFIRSAAEHIWNGSQYYHKGLKMKKDEDLVLPEKLRLKYAILVEDQDTGMPLLNPYLYKDFRKVVKSYSVRDEYPTMDYFREELLKTEAEGRLPFLQKSMQTPVPYSWVKQEISDYRHTLIFEKV